MDKNIFEILTEDAINERLDDTLLRDKKYRKISNKINNYAEQLNKLGLSKEQLLIIDKLISTHIESGYCYGRVTYQQGIRDCALLLSKMNLLK